MTRSGIRSDPPVDEPSPLTRVGDRQLQSDVVAELDWDSAVNAAHIGVTVTDGAVTLTGVVGSWPEKRAAFEAVKRVRGVHVIADEVEVHLRGMTGVSDTDIAVAAEHALRWAADVPQGAISATVNEHVITLEGAVMWDHQRRAAEGAVEGIAGLRWVRNLLTLQVVPSAPDLHLRIEAALTRHAAIEAGRITVIADEHEVHLRGRVDSWAERDAAERAAWSAPGVAKVHNHLHIG